MTSMNVNGHERTNGVSMNGTSTTTTATNMAEKNVGILGIEVYTPSTYIKQSSLEEYNKVSCGKYTIGLGQDLMSVIHGDREDINSICLTVVQSLLEKYNINPCDVGRLEVGTETLIDKSKSTKTVLMDLFGDNKDVEGATIVNACYGGTSALLNAFTWVESDAWDGRYAIVVAGDIAAYERGAARPTSGAGAVAVLVGRDASLVFDGRRKATHAANVWDFYKPDGGSEYPVVDGALSQTCYYEALEECYNNYTKKVEKLDNTKFNVESCDYWVFHSPYNKLVQKSYGRLVFLDARRSDSSEIPKEYLEKPINETYTDKALEKILKNASATSYKQRLTDANYASKIVGNTYTASVFLGLASLVDRVGDHLLNKSIGLFSYGSGAIATLYSLRIRESSNSIFRVGNIQKTMALSQRLNEREEVCPSELDYSMDTRARMQEAGAPYNPVYPHNLLSPGTYYLTGIDSKWRRSYARIPLDAEVNHMPNMPLAPPSVLEIAKREQVATPVKGKLSVVTEAKKRVACVITGISAGLPGQAEVFHKDNLTKCINGENCITQIPPSSVQDLLEKNVVQIKKCADGSIKRIPVQTEDSMISVAAQLAPLHLSETYGIPKGLVDTMDVAAQVAVAAGLEAMKDAGLVSGASNNLSDWKLPDDVRDTTGIVYASSFPAMDAAVAEVMKFLQSKSISNINTKKILDTLKDRFMKYNGGCISNEDGAAFEQLIASSQGYKLQDSSMQTYEFNRKFLFKVLVLANAQLAQLTGARGPNTQTNAACAGTTQAIAMAQDMLISGRAQRVVVIAGDNASGSTLLPWLGSGFRALGAASTANAVEDAAMPFDLRRNGMILGAGAIGMVLETEQSSIARLPSSRIKARLLQTQYSNSAFHGASMDRHHIASELERFLTDVEVIHGIPKADIAEHGVYLSHETSTHASPSTSCASNETAALRAVFGSTLLSKLLLCNTKGFTGHPMGVSFEDVVAVQILISQCVPPIPNFKVNDPHLGDDLNLSTQGGKYGCRYALRFSAGFGSQVAFALYEVFE